MPIDKYGSVAQRISTFASLILRQKREPFLERIVTRDEKWVCYVNIRHQRQWLDPAQKSLPDLKPDLHPKKLMLYIWWDMKGVVYFEFLDALEQLGCEILEHALYTPNVAASDYHLFLSLRNYLYDEHYENFNELKSDTIAFLESKPAGFYKRGIELLPARWAKIVENNGDYIID